MKIRPVQSTDLKEVQQLNEAAVPHVNSIGIPDFEYFMKVSSFFWVVEAEKALAGFLIVLGPGHDYHSENYQYFSKHYQSFDYVDRIVIAEDQRGKGMGAALYNRLFKESDAKQITCEVNIRPPNPGSIAFHEHMGFREADRQFTSGGSKEVSLMVRSKSTPVPG